MQREAEHKNAKRTTPSMFAGKQWQQVLARDVHADGQFVYAVESTGIFCRPSCPSRKPGRKQVRFFPTPALAQHAGFRACLRCQPENAEPRPDPQAEAIARVTEYMSTHTDTRAGLDEVAKATGVGRLTILRGFKRVLGVTPGQYARAARVERFKQQVCEPKKKITDALYETGFGSSSRLYEDSHALLGMTPGAMRSGGAGLVIRFAITGSPLGRMLVAATSRGVCSIAFGPDDKNLLEDLKTRFSKAQITPANVNTGWFAEAVRLVESQMTENPVAAAFPLDVRATAFQARVWEVLRAIPRGETRSYSQIAAQLGVPSASRAVGAAVGANPIAIVVPCHRVIAKDGKLSGYRWGVERKRKLLKAEGYERV